MRAHAARVAFAPTARPHRRHRVGAPGHRARNPPRAVNRDRNGADRGRERADREKKILPVDLRVDGASARSTSARDEVEIATNGAANGVDGAHASGASTERESETRSTSGDVGGRQISSDVVDPITAASDAATTRLRERLLAASAASSAEATQTQTRRPSVVVRKFEELEIEASALEALEAQMRDAVEIEDYNNAAALKRAVEALRATDATGRACDAYATAIEENRFEDASRLRDAGVGLCGWWAGVEERDGDDAGEDEDVAAPKGVIMKISRQHGRLVGSTFSPRDLADVIELNKAYPKGYAYDAGQPVLEILLQEDEDAAGGFRRDVARLKYVPQSVALASDEDENEDKDEDEDEENDARRRRAASR